MCRELYVLGVASWCEIRETSAVVSASQTTLIAADLKGKLSVDLKFV
jgi:hypothetical protein